MQIDKIMHRNVKIIGPDETLRDAATATAMKKLDVGVLPVGEHDKLVGMITDRDIAIRGIAGSDNPPSAAHLLTWSLSPTPSRSDSSDRQLGDR